MGASVDKPGRSRHVLNMDSMFVKTLVTLAVILGASEIVRQVLNLNLMFVVKTLVTLAVILGASEIVKRSPSLGALVVALPLTSVLVMIWMNVEGGNAERIADHSRSTFWYVLPTLPMFLILPRLLAAKWNFYWSLTLCCIVTIILVTGTQFLLKRLS